MSDHERHESTAAFNELLETLGGLDRSFLEGDRAVTDDRHVADGYRQILTTLGVALDTYLFAEPSRPVFVEVNTPYRRDHIQRKKSESHSKICLYPSVHSP